MSIKGLERITDKILADAEAEAARIRAEADARCAEILADAEARAARRREEMREVIQREATSHVTRAKSSAAMQKRNLLLEERSALVDRVFAAARESVRTLSDEAYTALLAGLLSAALLEQLEAERTSVELYGAEDIVLPDVYEVMLNQNDRSRCGDALLASVKKKLEGKVPRDKLARLKISPKPAPIEGGVILRCGDVESNGSFELLFAQLRDELETEVSGALFSGRTQI